MITGLPKEVIVTDSDVRDAVSHSIERLVEATKEVLEVTPPEILSDIMHRGVHLAGGGALRAVGKPAGCEEDGDS